MTRGTILVVDDEIGIQDVVQKILEHENFHVRRAGSVHEAKHEINQALPDVVILDRLLPDGDGIEVCNFIRSQPALEHIPILFLSQKVDIAERVAGLKVGGDDYLPKPFDAMELVARIEALFRRITKKFDPKQIVESGPIRLNLEKHECQIKGKAVTLQRKEFELLEAFLQSQNRVLTKDFLAERIWDTPNLATSRAIDTAVQRLRKKLGTYGECIETVRGYGFRFDTEKASQI